MNYLGDLIAGVAALRDRRSMDALLANIKTGNLATKGVAALGRTALDRVLGMIDANDTLVRLGATRTLSQMLDPEVVSIEDAASISRIKAGLLHASKDTDSWVRISAVEGLARLLEADVTTALRLLAERDPYELRGHQGEPPAYPVREAARKALASRPPGRQER